MSCASANPVSNPVSSPIALRRISSDGPSVGGNPKERSLVSPRAIGVHDRHADAGVLRAVIDLPQLRWCGLGILTRSQIADRFDL